MKEKEEITWKDILEPFNKKPTDPYDKPCARRGKTNWQNYSHYLSHSHFGCWYDGPEEK